MRLVVPNCVWKLLAFPLLASHPHILWNKHFALHAFNLPLTQTNNMNRVAHTINMRKRKCVMWVYSIIIHWNFRGNLCLFYNPKNFLSLLLLQMSAITTSILRTFVRQLLFSALLLLACRSATFTWASPITRDGLQPVCWIGRMGFMEEWMGFMAKCPDQLVAMWLSQKKPQAIRGSKNSYLSTFFCSIIN